MVVTSALSTGVLVGCVLGIILPEGFGASLESQSQSGSGAGGHGASAWVGVPLLGGYVVQVLLDLAAQRLTGGSHGGGGGGGGGHHHHQYHVVSKQSSRPHAPDTMEDEDEDIEAECLHDDGLEDGGDEEAARALGGQERRRRSWQMEALSATATTTIIELPPLGHHGAPRSPTAGVGGAGVSVRNPRRSASAASAGALAAAAAITTAGATHHPHASSRHHHHHRRRNSDTTSSSSSAASRCRCALFGTDFIGLLVHCLADGVALGSSSLSASAALRLSVFFALTLHKLPVAFATGAVIAHQTSSRSSSRATLVVHALAFSLASPLAALLTHGAAALSAHSSSSSGSSSSGSGSENEGAAEGAAVGGLLLFSGGSFLYVALGHLAPELLHAPEFRRPGPRAWLLLVVLLAGMAAAPLLAALAPEGEAGGEWHGH